MFYPTIKVRQYMQVKLYFLARIIGLVCPNIIRGINWQN